MYRNNNKDSYHNIYGKWIPSHWGKRAFGTRPQHCSVADSLLPAGKTELMSGGERQNKCVSKTQTSLIPGGAVKTMCNTVAPFSKGWQHLRG